MEPQPGTEVEVTEKEAGSIPAGGRQAGADAQLGKPDNADGRPWTGSASDTGRHAHFDPARRDMGGEYSASRERVGRVENSVKVVGHVSPRYRYENTTVNEGETATLECKAGGSPLPTVEFRKVGNDARFEPGTSAGDDRIRVTERVEDGFKFGTLTITNLNRTDDGLYECIASNKGGFELKNGHITTQFKPSFVNSPIREIYSWNNHPVNLTCVAESIPNATITWEFKRRLLEQDLDSNIQQIGNGPTSVLRVMPSDPTYFGVFTCKASNLLGQSMLDIELFEATVPSMLTDVKFDEVTATTVTFEMNGPASDGGLPLVAYAVQYKVAGESWDAKEEQLWPVGSNYVLDNLRPEQVFVFRFAAKNDVGLSEWSAEQQMIMPKRDVPEAPIIMLPDSTVRPEDDANLVVKSVFSDSYTVQWQAGANNGEKIDNFEISYYEVASTGNGWRSLSDKRSSVVDFPGTHTFKVSNLKAQTHYRIELRAHNKIGFGNPAELVVLTAPGAPSPGGDPTGGVSTTVASPLGISLLLLAAIGPCGSSLSLSEPPALASAALVGVVVGVLLVLLLLIDLTCYAVNSRGIVYALCSRRRGRSGAVKLTNTAASEKEPLQHSKNGNGAGHGASDDRDVPAVVVQGASPAAASNDSAV
ncbi:fasciclin-2-like [Pollicipes pollicipes]|uniref:fasciclin-2-like n=1 Tax=Pollicipes pollicipes TaxID=41117 RepID=UPI00188516BD|nr:fasciclin-2-like [Pollicipes pollicipes]